MHYTRRLGTTTTTVEAALGVRPVANERLCDSLDLSSFITVLEIADILVDQPWLFVLLVSILEDLGMLANLHVQLIIDLPCCFAIAFSLDLNSDVTLVIHRLSTPREMIHRRRLDYEGTLLRVTRGRDGHTVLQVHLLVLLAEPSINALRLTLWRYLLGAILVEFLRVIDEALHLLVMYLFLHICEIF